MAAGLANRRQPLEETVMFSSGKRINRSPRGNEMLFLNTFVYWSAYRGSGRKVGAQKLGIFYTLHYEGSGLAIRNDVVSYKQFFGPMLDYACLIWTCFTRTNA